MTNALDPPHWTLNSCFATVRTVWVHLRLFGCLTKLGAKHFELVQKFVPRRRVGVFRDERTRSTPLDPKHMFWCVSYHLRAFGTVRLLYETQGKTFRTSIKVRATKSRRSFSRRTHPIHPIGPETHVLLCFVPFGTVWLPYETRCKTGRTCAKVRETKLRQNFSQQTHSIHSIGP